MTITRESVNKIASLARLELSDAELARMTTQLSAILDYVDQLKQVPTDGVEPMAHPIAVHSVFRADELGTSLPVDLALANAPDRQGEFFGVPAVLE